MTYLAPSVLGINSDGFGGSLWHRGTLTGLGLFRGAGNKILGKKEKEIQKEVSYKLLFFNNIEENKFITLCFRTE